MDVKSLLTENVEGRDGRNESTLTSMSLGSSMEGGGEKSMGFSPLSSIGFLLNDEDEGLSLPTSALTNLSPKPYHGSPCSVFRDEKIVEVSRKDQLRYSCDMCGRFFRVRRDLIHHVRCVHEQSRPFACSLCPSKFSIRPNLSRHIRTVHEKQKPFKCEECDRHFGLKENLDKHIRLVHEKQRPFTCEYCGYAFGIMSTLKRHIQRNHQKEQGRSHPILAKP